MFSGSCCVHSVPLEQGVIKASFGDTGFGHFRCVADHKPKRGTAVDASWAWGGKTAGKKPLKA